MRKLLAVLGFVLVFAQVQAEEEAPPPLDPQFMGSHGMVLMSSESDLYASFLPELSGSKQQQLIYLIDAKGPEVFFLTRDADRVTIKTKPFNLQRLMRGETVEVAVDVYLGNYEQGGSLMFPEVPINFVEQLYYRPLEKLEPSGLRQTYDMIELGGENRMFVHRIKHKPSFDHIILVEEARNCVTQFFTSEAVPSEQELLMKLLFCGSIKPLYYNTEAFQ
ncbi:hypothetical protein QTP81_00520 [Alteromonas sp. ASW11-36]|uniref:Uncharacterized protein n=1 Tax=Alteromonas arenosi TaxID=3055817 RepID=A0ABT7SSF9_9ALTE|nr:hypothetical protein [Alteromonas sp. ASW11-36]MDM7859085.1 hypothetical protein [Alteromonas sp. ASW11-36]